MQQSAPADPLPEQRRRALVSAAWLIAAFGVLDLVHRNPASFVVRLGWIAMLAAGAALQRRPAAADHAARGVGLGAGILGPLLVAAMGGADGPFFSFLYGIPLVVLVLVPDLPSSAILAGLGATVGGVLLLTRVGRPVVEIVEWAAVSVTLVGFAAWGTLLYGRRVRSEWSADAARTDALEQLTRSEERFRAAFSSPTLGMAVVSTDGTIVVANGALQRMLGGDCLVGRSYFDLLDPAEVAHAREVRGLLLAGQSAPRVSRRFVNAAGGRVLAWVHASPVHSRSGAIDSAIIMFEDVTERHRLREQLATSEAMFRDLAERAMVGVYLIQDGAFQYVNPRFAEVFGYDRERLGPGFDYAVLVRPEHRALVAGNMRRRLEGEVDALQFEFDGVTRAGRTVSVEVFGSRTTYRSRPAILGTLLDVTDRKRSEAERIRMQKLESVGVLAGGIAHDFNNLLAVILGDVSFASAQAAADPALREALEDAEAATLRARELTAQLLTFSRGGEPVKRPLVLDAALSTFASFAVRGSRSRCELAVGRGLWPVLADEGQIGQVVQNLVLNAVQSMADGGVVRVAAENLDADEARRSGLGELGRCVRVTVADSGPGIPPEIAHRLFDPYFTTKKTGSGLGLATAHSIVTRHGGTIGLDPSARSGATFYFALPAPEGLAGPAAPRPALAPVPGRGRVVVMDDDELVRRAAIRMLTHLGFAAVAARDGRELLAVCDEARRSGHPIDVALLDLTVPDGMGGAEAVRRLTDSHPGMKTIVSSGYSSDPIMADFARYGFSGVLVKPYQVGDLSDALGRVLGDRATSAHAAG